MVAQPLSAAHRVGWAVFLAATGLLLATALGLYLAFSSSFFYSSSPAQRDPRLDYAGPFRNVAPAVRYVPEGRCADCHADIARSFAEHPMGRSLLPVAQAAVHPENGRHNNPFDALG